MPNLATRAPLITAAAIVISIAVLLLFAITIQAGVGVMILLVVVVVALCVTLLWFLRGASAAVLMVISENNRHVEEAMRLGHNPRGYVSIAHQIAAPVQAAPVAQLADPRRGVHFSSNNIAVDAVNLLLFSVNLLGRDGNRIASNPECAQANLIGYNGKKWNAIIHEYLEKRLGLEIATQTGPVENGGGVFVPTSIGTVGNLYDMLVRNELKDRQDDAVNALPEVTR
jgi:hypothetical protein